MRSIRLLAMVLGMTLLGFACAPPASPTKQVAHFEETSEARDAFASDRVASVTIDGKRFHRYLESICALGPRVSGTSAMRKQQELISAHFEKLKLTVKKQTFQAKQTT